MTPCSCQYHQYNAEKRTTLLHYSPTSGQKMISTLKFCGCKSKATSIESSLRCDILQSAVVHQWSVYQPSCRYIFGKAVLGNEIEKVLVKNLQVLLQLAYKTLQLHLQLSSSAQALWKQHNLSLLDASENREAWNRSNPVLTSYNNFFQEWEPPVMSIQFQFH